MKGGWGWGGRQFFLGFSALVVAFASGEADADDGDQDKQKSRKAILTQPAKATLLHERLRVILSPLSN